MLAWAGRRGARCWPRWRTGSASAAARRRAEELLRLGQVARLNTLGELAAGMAHELNQPLTAVLANTQAARRLLDDDPPELATARDAMAQAAEQARRAADVVGRLRRAVERPDLARQLQAVQLAGRRCATRCTCWSPNATRRGVTPQLHAAREPLACWPTRWRWSRSCTTC